MKKFPDLLLMIVVLATLIMFTFSSFNNQANDNPSKNKIKVSVPSFPDSLFQSGDLIFREGRGFISTAFRKLSLIDPRYSHAGIIHREKEKIFVYHIIGGEGNSSGVIRKDFLSIFCSPLQSNAFGIYRTDQDGHKIDSLAGYYYSKKIGFDPAFNLASDDKMYCTELLYKILKKVSGQENFLPLTTLSGMKYESCDNIYLSSHSKKIYSFRY